MSKGTALVTGASGGIGRVFAVKLAREGYDVVVAARSRGKLEEVAKEIEGHGVRGVVIESDLSKPDAPKALFEAVREEGLQVDVLINNAGFATYGHFASIELDKELEMINLNVTALVHLTRLFVPEMVARKRGRVVNVASTAAFQPGPLMANYYASKAYVLHFSEAIANELQGTGVTVTALCPGPTASGFQERAGMDNVKLVKSGLMSAEKVVDIGYRGMLKGKPVVIPGLKNRMLAQSTRFFPRKMTVKVVRNLQSEG
ncbi:MAG: SDR family NAD(P)-dependent oxidoreductase [Spirochaetales bacterium]